MGFFDTLFAAKHDTPISTVTFTLDNAAHTYEDGNIGLDATTLTITPSDRRVAVIGLNGSGKTTLAKHLNGLLKPDRGTITVDGLDVAKHSVGEMAAHVGFVFQNPDHQIFCSSTREEISFGPTALGLDGGTVFRRVDEMMTLFDLHRYEEVSPATLGYGERRAVALASVLAMRTPILVLDEPTAGLDHRLSQRFLGAIKRLNEQGTTIVMISHDMRAVYRYCSHVLQLQDGHVVQFGPIDKTGSAQHPQADQHERHEPITNTHGLRKISKHHNKTGRKR